MNEQYEHLIFEDGKIRIRHEQVDFTRDSRPEEVWEFIQALVGDRDEWYNHYLEVISNDPSAPY